MRKIPAALAVLTLAVVSLTGCSMPGASGCTRPAVPDQDVMDLIKVSGSTDAAPQVDVRTPFHTTDVSFQDVETGDGTPITSDKQLVVVDISVVSGKTGEVVAKTGYSGDLTSVRPVSALSGLFPKMGDALHCATEGSRVVLAVPPGGVEAQTAASIGLAGDESAVAVIDLRKVYLPKADGSNVYNTGQGLPTVVRAPDGRPGIIVPDGAPPTKLAVQTLKKGDGEVVTGDVPVRVHYTGVLWDAKTVFDTTWDGEPKSITLDSVVPGLATALKGATVGSQIMVVVPPDKGYGDQAQGSIPAGSTLVFVVDILGLDAPATTTQ
ncbi:FKBP-type peptidyl-prolyl cis-trans isomerase [Microbacterium deminutum]|uniref:peptidylprolyl isomerase n=1 Tax=Microbacterium deminutum TaxID=344164 RepID=A0ABP5BSM3_9MICO